MWKWAFFQTLLKTKKQTVTQVDTATGFNNSTFHIACRTSVALGDRTENRVFAKDFNCLTF